MLATVLSVVTTVLLCLMIVFLANFKRSLPDIQQVLDDVGANIGEQISGIFEKPIVKAAMTNLGKKSGEARASEALRNKAAEAIIDRSPFVGRILSEMGFSALEGLQLFNDPIIGPIIQKGAASFMQGVQKGNFGGSRTGNSGGNPYR